MPRELGLKKRRTAMSYFFETIFVNIDTDNSEPSACKTDCTTETYITQTKER
jgi:hypothetical protein